MNSPPIHGVRALGAGGTGDRILTHVVEASDSRGVVVRLAADPQVHHSAAALSSQQRELVDRLRTKTYEDLGVAEVSLLVIEAQEAMEKLGLRGACLREAGRRYQGSRAGRFPHARRARRYRQRQKIVTHQASQRAPLPTTVVVDPAQAEVVLASAVTAPAWHCCGCGGVCLPVVRRGFLRHGRVPEVAPRGRRGSVHGQSP